MDTTLPDGEAARETFPPNDTRAASGAVTIAVNPALEYVVGVRLISGGRVGDYHWNNIELMVGDLCVVEERGGYLAYGVATLSRRPAAMICRHKRPAGKVIRRASEEDTGRAHDNERKEKAALAFCQERIYERNLNMNLARAQYSFDGRKAVFFFTSESRVDFRDLVKDLSTFTRVKVEMRQIGVRDEARMLGGCGPCGQELCCSRFLPDFIPVSIRMAKDQFLSLSPEKISGVCGRLMCCLSYEHGMYKEMLKGAPKLGKSAVAPDGRKGKVIQINALTGKIGLVFEDGVKAEYTIGEFTGAPPPVPEPQDEIVEDEEPAPRHAFTPMFDLPAGLPAPLEEPAGEEEEKPEDRGAPFPGQGEGATRRRRRRRGRGGARPSGGMGQPQAPRAAGPLAPPPRPAPPSPPANRPGGQTGEPRSSRRNRRRRRGRGGGGPNIPESGA